MLAEINRRFAVEMLAQFRVHALAVIRVNPPIPFVERVADFLNHAVFARDVHIQSPGGEPAHLNGENDEIGVA